MYKHEGVVIIGIGIGVFLPVSVCKPCSIYGEISLTITGPIGRPIKCTHMRCVKRMLMEEDVKNRLCLFTTIMVGGQKYFLVDSVCNTLSTSKKLKLRSQDQSTREVSFSMVK